MPQTTKDVDESCASLINFFERIQICLQRINTLSEIPSTAEIKEILWEIMAEALSTLAVFTKTMKENGFSRSIPSIHPLEYLTNRGTEKILRGFVRRTDLEDVPQRLNTLTREGSLLAMSMAGNLEATHNDGSAMATGELVRDVNDLDNITAIREDHHQKQVINNRTHTFVVSSCTYQLGFSGYAFLVTTDSTTKDLATPETSSTDGKSGSTPTQDPLRDKLRLWLTPPDPSTNHSAACKTRYDGTARWLNQNKTFRSWKKNGPLLWIHGKRTLLVHSVLSR